MNTLDVVILIVAAVGLVRGLMTGAVRQVISAVAMIAALVLAWLFMDAAGAVLAGATGLSREYAPAAGFLAVFVVIQVTAFVLVHMLEKLLGALRLSALNRVAGGVVGTLKAGLLLSAFFLLLIQVDLPERPAREQSVLYAPVAMLLPWAWDTAVDRVPEAGAAVDSVRNRAVDAVLPE